MSDDKEKLNEQGNTSGTRLFNLSRNVFGEDESPDGIQSGQLVWERILMANSGALYNLVKVKPGSIEDHPTVTLTAIRGVTGKDPSYTILTDCYEAQRRGESVEPSLLSVLPSEHLTDEESVKHRKPEGRLGHALVYLPLHEALASIELDSIMDEVSKYPAEAWLPATQLHT
ncbi:hypothetical protein HY218_01925 [Candidatus Saccharibacteria bacterium]|nr:hypothetical protein [Candidatus Saccharibacteria bacterium]